MGIRDDSECIKCGAAEGTPSVAELQCILMYGHKDWITLNTPTQKEWITEAIRMIKSGKLMDRKIMRENMLKHLNVFFLN